MEVKRYGAEEARTWDLAVTASRQGTFLLMRHYMDYHADRFTDASLLFYDGSHGRLRGVLPATVDGDTAVSHGGLTYGGLLTPAGVGAKPLAAGCSINPCRTFTTHNLRKRTSMPFSAWAGGLWAAAWRR